MSLGGSYQIRGGREAKPTDNMPHFWDFQRSLSFAATQSSFDKMLVEMDQNNFFFAKFEYGYQNNTEFYADFENVKTLLKFIAKKSVKN